MNKLLSTLTAGAAVLFLASGLSLAADQTRPTEETPARAPENQPGPTAPVTTGDETKQNPEYLAALKKCDSMKDSKKQQSCIDAAKKKYEHM